MDLDNDSIPDGCDSIIDSDDDDVDDNSDICDGGNDSIDSDSDGIPDFCDDNIDLETELESNNDTKHSVLCRTRVNTTCLYDFTMAIHIWTFHSTVLYGKIIRKKSINPLSSYAPLSKSCNKRIYGMSGLFFVRFFETF